MTQKTLPQGEYLVRLEDGATVLCATHMSAVRLACEAAGVDVDIWTIPDDEEPMTCQACHLAEVQAPRIILQ